MVVFVDTGKLGIYLRSLPIPKGINKTGFCLKLNHGFVEGGLDWISCLSPSGVQNIWGPLEQFRQFSYDRISGM